MIKIISTFYNLLKYSILLLFIVGAIIIFILESPATVLTLLKQPLSEQGISYGKMQGGLLSGFTLKDVNYNNQVKADELALKVDIDALKQRVLKIDNLVLKNASIDKTFLASLMENNSSDVNKSESNLSLPFDRLVLKKADVSLKDIAYDNYYIHSAKLHLQNVDTDLKENHQAEFSLLLDSNITQVSIEGSIKDNKYDVLANIEGEKAFLSPFLSDYNLSMLKNPKLKLKAKGDVNKIEYDVSIEALKLKQKEYFIESKALRTFGSFDMENNLSINSLKSEFDGNIAYLKLNLESQVDLDDINKSLSFDIDGKLDPKQDFTFLDFSEQNISIESLPKVRLLAKGTLEKLSFKSTLYGLKAKQNDLKINIKDFNANGDVKVFEGDVNLALSSQFDSSALGGEIHAKSSVNYKDINNSLSFDLDSKLKIHHHYLNKILQEQNITLLKESQLKLKAKGTMNHIAFETYVNNFRAKQNDLKIDVKKLSLKGETKPLQGDTKVFLKSIFDSSIAKGDIESKAKLNFKDINGSLSFEAKSNLTIYDVYVNRFLEDANVSLRGESDVKLSTKGTMNKVEAKVDLESKVFAQNMLSALSLHTSPIIVDLKTHQINGSLKLNSRAKEIGLNISSQFSGDYLEPKALQTRSKIDINHFHAFDVNLNSLTPIHIDAKSSMGGVEALLNSKKLKLKLTSSDYEHIEFDVQSAKIYPAKIVKVPDELKKKFVKIDLRGDANIAMLYLKAKGAIESNKGFKINIDMKNNAQGLDAKLSTKHLIIKASGNIETKKIKAKVEIDSIQKLEEELVLLYPFSVVPMKGAVSLKAKLDGERITANLSSPKIKLDGFNIEKIKLDALYENDMITLNTLNLNTTGFKDKKLNKKFYLNKKAKIHLGERRDISLDMHPNIKVDVKGTVEKLKGTFTLRDLALGHPDYGTVLLSSQINYEQIGKKKKIVGGIALEKLKLFYEAKFMDPANDADVVIIRKKDKGKKEKDSFLEDTFIDLAVYAPDAKYKTRDIDLKFTVDVKAKKMFGKSLGILGRVKEINGRVEQAPKVFEVVDSNIVFRGNKEINPLLDIQVEHELPDVLITINIHGDANRPKLDFSSEPQMPKKDILSYLLLGISTASLSNGEGNLGREAELFIMNQAARDLAYEVELDRVLIKDDGTGEGYAIQVGKKINDKTMAVIENSKEGNSFILEYEVNKNIKIEVGQHQKTIPSQSIDIFFRKKFK